MRVRLSINSLSVNLCWSDWYFLELGQQMDSYEHLLKKNICRCLVFFPLCSLFLFVSLFMFTCWTAPPPYIQNDHSNSVSIFPRHSLLSSFTIITLSPSKKVLVWVLLFSGLIFQCCITIISISVPSGLSTVYLPISPVSSSEHVCEKLYWRVRRESSLLIWLPFSFKWWYKAFQMKKSNLPWFTRKCWLCPWDKYMRYKVYEDCS